MTDVPNQNNAIVRVATTEDADALAGLLTTLGYPATAGDVERRLATLSDRPDYVTLVACDGARVIAVGGAFLHLGILHDEPVARLTGLVVDEACRGRGVGARLMAHLEAWARQHGATQVTLTSRMHRQAAHAFYRHLGYEQTGVRFTKQVRD